YRQWSAQTQQVLAEVELPYLDALVCTGRYIPDFLTPTPDASTLSIEAELQRLMKLPTQHIRNNIQFLIDLDSDSDIRQQFLVYPHEMMNCLIDDLRLYWRLVLEPHWSAMVSILEGDILYRARQLAIEGTTSVISDLSPHLVMKDNQIQLKFKEPPADPPYPMYHDITGRGMRLVPSMFINQSVSWQMVPEAQPMLVYGARGVGQWQQIAPLKNQSLELLIGEGRASVLMALANPASTTELAHHLMMTAGAVSQHLNRLHETGLVEPHRSGKRVYYYLSRRGEQLLRLFA
ncbi:MAG TPA: winged helix-turn-helix domain-containing protein, partial [Phototrophicaceae bacterium]|nr:winged helix-turn-helix domain-containing protein [Phototrophicaceae bacterium]